MVYKDKMIEYTGTLNSGNQTISVTKSNNGWNLVGNPYPSYIDWDKIFPDATNINNAVYFYDVSNNQYESRVDYVGASKDIPSGQGFFVHCNDAGGGSLPLTINHRLNASQTFWKKKKGICFCSNTI